MKTIRRFGFTVLFVSVFTIAANSYAEQGLYQVSRRVVDYDVDIDSPEVISPSADFEVGETNRVVVTRPVVRAPQAGFGVRTPTLPTPYYTVPSPNVPGVDISTPTFQAPSLSGAGFNFRTPSF